MKFHVNNLYLQDDLTRYGDRQEDMRDLTVRLLFEDAPKAL